MGYRHNGDEILALLVKQLLLIIDMDIKNLVGLNGPLRCRCIAQLLVR